MFPLHLDKFLQHYRRWLDTGSLAVQQPLLDTDALRDLSLYAQSLPASLLHFQHSTVHPLIGETLSFFRGRGFEFDENRPYQAGDEPRLINWHLYARSGNLYTKVFTEERRPQVSLIVDRRSPMRFGTREQLKVTLAAKIAACYAYQARHQALAVGGLILNQDPAWFSPAPGEIALQRYLQALVAPCPPLDFDAPAPDFTELLQQLIQRTPTGCFVLLVSDFNDLNPAVALPVLHQLATRHTVHAIQILDPVEQQPPTSGDFLIEDTASPQPLRLDGKDSMQQRQYSELFNQRQLQLQACFEQSGVPLQICSTLDGIEQCLAQNNA
jgi:uncharacterized protein (DUF58 family)